ncbi:MAG: RluA family pseudouridine synthase [Planctomycetes bacterium]|nr:RluA family pseudouridine synthase [Planctomycetota bacterium]
MPTEQQTENSTTAGVKKVQLRIKREIPGRRIDRYLSLRFAAYSRTLIQQLIRQGQATVCGRKIKPSYELHKGDVIRVRFPVVEQTLNKPEDIPIEVVYEDDAIIAINKQAYIVTHPSPGHSGGTLLNAILHHCEQLLDLETDRPGIVHRLDKDTTGIMLFAKTEDARTNIQQQFEHRKVEKTYTAIMECDPQLDADLIDLAIGQHKTRREKMAIHLDGGRPAQTVYQVLERFGDYTLVKCMPRTGRTHQIRVHLAAIGHPIACDDLYGARAPVFPSTLDEQIVHTESEEPLIERQALHATTIAFRHPETLEWIELEAGFRDDFERLLTELRKRGPVAPQRPRGRVGRKRK